MLTFFPGWNAKLSRDPVISKPRNLKSAYILDNILLVLKSEVRESYRIMAGRRQAGNQIRGPHSALTDFLASNNISAAQIANDYQQRVREAERQAELERANSRNDEEEYEESVSETPEERKKRKRKEAATLNKIKQSKAFARRKSRYGDDDPDYDDELARDMMYQKSRPLPGQFDNCENCSKRFTVTAYSKTGPNGGLLCAKCSKELADEEKKTIPKKRGPKNSRRQNRSNLLDGIVQTGALSLAEMCTKKVADNINDVEEFGDLPHQLLHRLSQILSKRRVLTPRTLNLFLRPDLDSINIYDCGKLETDDFRKIFTFMPSLVDVNLRFAGQMKDPVLDYVMDRNLKIKRLQLDAANLISDDCWRRFFQKMGPHLESLKLSNLDSSLDDETVKEICTHCTGLHRLKLKECWKTGDDSLRAITNLKSLEHLSLDFLQDTQAETIANLVDQLGPNLRTLSLHGFRNANDTLLECIHRRCSKLSKLRLSDNAVCTDKGYANLFTNWPNPPLTFVDLSSTRDVDNANPSGPPEPIGLASEGFVALMEHSGLKIRSLNISSCRHISRDAFEQVFGKNNTYPHLEELDISFHTVVDDYLVNCIFKACPAMKKLVAFACFNVRDVRVPAGVALIGGLNAQDSIVLEGGFQ
ncbi:leucine rich repeat protein [Paecilomyces variotii]|uniref:Leucine rich repeat protein n=1 Tax=Byssochlamys spectabilis TaxID=264951 RepID=A0A443HMT4_BYSSP|nr:leucine rich repeat protein [Paecilomyces variotii]RWQ93117.1 leucine rich repeat protein [Paecilomyces variotii]